jgi:hypothetical protein
MQEEEGMAQNLLILLSSIEYEWEKSHNEIFYQDEFFGFLEHCEEIIVAKSND